MPEQFANLGRTTLSVLYTAGSGGINVVDGTPFPSAGTFSVTLVDSVTNTVLMIFRVTSVSGNAYVGAAEGPDVNCPAGTLVYGTMLTAAAMAQIKIDASVPGGISPPPVATLIQNNVDHTTASDNTPAGTGFTMVVAGLSNTTDIQVIGVGLGAFATYNFDVAMEFLVESGPGGFNGGCGLVFAEDLSVTTKRYSAMIFGASQAQNQGAGIWPFTNVNTFGVQPKTGFLSTQSPVQWMRLRDDGVNRTYWLSIDGVNWQQYFTETRNTGGFVPAFVGVICFNYAVACIMNVRSWNLVKT